MANNAMSEAINYGLSIVGAPYVWWTHGSVPDGPPAWVENGPPPPPEQVIAEGCFCAGVPNLMLRAVGKEIPTIGDPNWDGGTRAYYQYYNNKGVREDFNINENYPEGTLIGRLYRNPSDQGHVAVVLGNGNILQAYDAGLGKPGVNASVTVSESNTGGYYEYAVRPENWIGSEAVEDVEERVLASVPADVISTDVTSTNVSSNLTADHLLACMPTNLSRELAAYYLPYLTEAMAEFEINDNVRAAYFLANLATESGELIYWEELADGWAYEGREDLGNIYEGDGPRYKGHGPIQITGRSNHRVVGQALGIDAEADPLLLTRVEYGFQAAAYYVRNMSAWGNLNEYADVGDFTSYVKGINGGTNGWDDRVYHLNLAWNVLPDDLSVGAGGGLVFEKYNLVAAPDKPWDRALAYAAGATLNAEDIPTLVLTRSENIRAASSAAYHGEAGQYGCLVVGSSAHDHLDPIDQPFDRWEAGIDTWKCWTDDRSDEGTLRILRDKALPFIAEQEGKPDLVERFDGILKSLGPEFEGALNNL